MHCFGRLRAVSWLFICVVAVWTGLLVAGCASPRQAPSVAAGTSSPAAAAATSPAPATSATGTPPSPAAEPPSPGAAPTSCAAFAANTFLQITAVQAAADGALTLTGYPESVVCGGPDDLHYDPAATTVTAHVIPGASIMGFNVASSSLVPVAPDALASYLTADMGTRIFLVSGPLSAISSLQEEYHP